MATFKISFKYSDFVYCANLATADTVEKVNEFYSRYEWFTVREATASDIEEAKRKGMPIINL